MIDDSTFTIFESLADRRERLWQEVRRRRILELRRDEFGLAEYQELSGPEVAAIVQGAIEADDGVSDEDLTALLGQATEAKAAAADWDLVIAGMSTVRLTADGAAFGMSDRFLEELQAGRVAS